MHRAQSDTEQRNLLDEIDGYNVRIGQLEKQLSMKQETINTLQTNGLSYQESIMKYENEVGDLRNQLELSRRHQKRLDEESDKSAAENMALRRENE